MNHAAVMGQSRICCVKCYGGTIVEMVPNPEHLPGGKLREYTGNVIINSSLAIHPHPAPELVRPLLLLDQA